MEPKQKLNYDPSKVDAALVMKQVESETVTAENEALGAECAALRKENDELRMRFARCSAQLSKSSKQLAELRNVETELRDLLLNAQKMANQIVVDAYRESEFILDAARAQAVAQAASYETVLPLGNVASGIIDLDALFETGRVERLAVG